MGLRRRNNSVATFNNQNIKLFKGLAQSEIPKDLGQNTEMTSTIRGAFNQVSSIVEAHEFRFNKGKNKKVKDKKSRSKRVQLAQHSR